MPTPRVSALYCYSIKSCKGHALQGAHIDSRGIVGDRSMMIVDANNEFLTQRELPRLALIEPVVHDDGKTITLCAPGMDELTLTPSNDGRNVKARVWKSICDAVDQGNDAALWLQDFLAQPVRLVRMADDFRRALNPQFARSERDTTGFADGYPFLLVSQASLDDLNARLTTQGAMPVPMNRFRPNIVVEGRSPKMAGTTFASTASTLLASNCAHAVPSRPSIKSAARSQAASRSRRWRLFARLISR